MGSLPPQEKGVKTIIVFFVGKPCCLSEASSRFLEKINGCQPFSCSGSLFCVLFGTVAQLSEAKS
jgi:hypothetical protein